MVVTTPAIDGAVPFTTWAADGMEGYVAGGRGGHAGPAADRLLTGPEPARRAHLLSGGRRLVMRAGDDTLAELTDSARRDVAGHASSSARPCNCSLPDPSGMGPSGMGAAPANLLFIIADMFRADCLGCTGNPVIRTPNLDRLAAAGTAFTHCFVQAAPCGPSRSCIYTGRYLCSTRSLHNRTPLVDAEQNFGYALRERRLPAGADRLQRLRGGSFDPARRRSAQPLTELRQHPAGIRLPVLPPVRQPGLFPLAARPAGIPSRS